MIRVLDFDGPEDARRRGAHLGIGEPDLDRLVADLRPLLVSVPWDDPVRESLDGALGRQGVLRARGSRSLVFSVSSREQVEGLMSGDPAGRAALLPVAGAIRRFEAREFAVPCRDRVLDLSGSPRVMGILNVTPDSFSDGGLHLAEEDAVRRGLAMAREGADIVDVGGESTRPGSAAVPEDVELSRVVPVIRELAGRTDALISVDTTKAAVARAAALAGAHIVNDTSALGDDPEMAAAVRDTGCAVILMHRRGTPATMQEDPRYESLFDEMLDLLRERMEGAMDAGIPGDRILVDPGIGFGKRLADNLALHRRLSDLRNLGRPVVFGSSRKSFIGALTGKAPPERLFGTIASVAVAAARGAHVLRVHDVGATVEAVAVVRAIGGGEEC